MTLQYFAEKCCDRLYNPKLGEEAQSSGWLKLKELVLGKKQPTEKDWRIFHPLLRKFLKENWENIIVLPIENCININTEKRESEKYTEKEVEFLLKKQREHSVFAISLNSEIIHNLIKDIIIKSPIINYKEILKLLKNE